MEILITILIFIVVLGILVFVHEFGHFIAAKKSGVAVEEFGFGYPPRMFGKKIGQTTYSLNWIPIGGFVKIKGVVGDDENIENTKKEKNSFTDKSFIKKFIILFAGIGMNFILAVIVFTAAYAIGAAVDAETAESGGTITNKKVVIQSILPDSPAKNAGLQVGNEIISINNIKVENTETIQNITKNQLNQNITFEIVTSQNLIAVINVQSKEYTFEEEKYTGIGVGLQEIATIKYPLHKAFWLSLKTTGFIVVQIGLILFEMIRAIFTSSTLNQDFAGPVGIASMTGQAARLGFVPLLQFIGLLSINLGIFNLLPIPALDGGRIIFLILEKIRKKAVNQKTEAIIHNIGFILLMLILLLVTFKDIVKI